MVDKSPADSKVRPVVTAQKPSALVLAPFSETHLSRLRDVLDVVHESWLDSRRIYDPEELAARLASDGTSFLLVESDFVFEDMLERAQDLEFVGICRSATNHVEVEAATRHGVAVVNTPGRNAQAVAEHVLGLMLSLARNIPKAHVYVTDGSWRNPAEPYLCLRGIELSGRTLGIVGLGAIGRKLASLGSGIGMTVLANDPFVDSAPSGVRLTDLEALLSESDFVALLAPTNEETAGLIDAERLREMQQGAYLINTSGIDLVDQDALVELLSERRIAGAALDVFESHPISPDSPLLGMDNVVLTPHIGGATQETVERHSAAMADDIERFLSGRRPVNLVNPEVWDRRA